MFGHGPKNRGFGSRVVLMRNEGARCRLGTPDDQNTGGTAEAEGWGALDELLEGWA